MEIVRLNNLRMCIGNRLIDSCMQAAELQRWRTEEERKLKEARLTEEEVKTAAQNEKAKCSVASQTKKTEAENDDNNSMAVPIRYRRYTIDEIEEATEHFSESRKIGEGGYGPVFKCFLDHTVVAVKVLRPDAAQGREQFQQEV